MANTANLSSLGQGPSVSRLRSLLLCLVAASSPVLVAQVPKTPIAPLCNPKSTPQTVALKNYLNSVWGHKIIAGQVNDKWLPLIESETGGKDPAIIGYDFNGITPNGNPSTWNDDQKAIDWVKNHNGIAQFQWHWTSPDGGGGSQFYSGQFNLAGALADPKSNSYKNLIRDIDLVAGAIGRMQDAGVPILFRPLHEAEGGWFWWGPDKNTCLSLFNLMYDRFVNTHHLNNIIWIWNSYGGEKKGNWYPGNDKADMLAYDYPDDHYWGVWSEYTKLFGNDGKLWAMGESGPLPDPNMVSSTPWLYFMTWDYEIQQSSVPANTPQWVHQVYNDSRIVTLTDLPSTLYGGLAAVPGPDQTVVVPTGQTSVEVKVNGLGSTNPGGPITSYVWSENGVTLANTAEATLTLGLGSHTLTLTVGANGKTNAATMTVNVTLPNLALKKPVLASSTEAGNNVAANAVDGDTSTRWSSLYSDPQWIYVDLQGTYNITGVTLNWETASAKTYHIDVSNDGTQWADIKDVAATHAGPRVDTLSDLKGTGRFVRISGLTRDTQWGYSLYEFQVYGNQDFNTLNVTPATASLPSDGGNADLTVTSNVSAWTVASDQAWLTVSPGTGSANGSIKATAASNTGSVSRTAHVTVAGSGLSKVVTLTQDPSVLDLSPISGVGPQGGTVNATVNSSGSTWMLNCTQPWVTFAPMSGGAGTTPVVINVAPNPTTTPRVAPITLVNGTGLTKTTTLNQTGHYILANPSTVALAQSGAAQTVSVTSTLPWTAASDQAWLSVTPGNGTLQVSAAPNPGSTARTATITLTTTGAVTTKATITVTQAGIQNQLSVSPSTLSFTATGGSNAVAVTGNVAWTATSDSTWLAVTPASGTGNGTLAVTAAANAGPARQGVITVSGGGITQTVAVSQATSNPGPVTVSAAQAASSSEWYSESRVTVSSTAPITAMSLTVNLAKTPGASYNGQYNTGGGIVMSHADTGSAVSCTFALQPGATLNAGSITFSSQLNLSGTKHAVSGDTWTLTYTSGGQTYTKTGGF